MTPTLGSPVPSAVLWGGFNDLLSGFRGATNRMLAVGGGSWNDPDPRFGQRFNDGPKQIAELRFDSGVIPGLADVRLTSIGGTRACIFNLMVFPHHPGIHPIFASEIVILANSMRIAVVDLENPRPFSSMEPTLESALSRYDKARSQLALPDVVPGWCEPHFTPKAIHTKCDDLGTLGLVEHLFTGYMRVWMEHVHSRVAIDHPSAGDLGALADYKSHHVENSPGRTFLSRIFGAEWTEDFMRQGMYA